MTTKKELAQWISARIALSGRTQGEIARDAGISSQNFLSMLKSGAAKVPLRRVPALADALDVSRIELLFKVLRADHPELAALLREVLPDLPETVGEISVIRAFRVLRDEGLVDEEGCEIRALRGRGRMKGWARVSNEEE